MNLRWFVAPLLIAILVLLAIPAAAGTVTFTSTADFDAGTKSSSAGNFDVETNTDNLGIATGGFELGSLKGDSFTLADTDADTFKWDLVANADPCGSITRDISGGVLNIDLVGNAANSCRRGVRSSATITGDWDIRWKVDHSALSGTQNIYEFAVYNEAVTYCSDSGTVDGLLYQAPTKDAVNDIINAFTCVNGAFTQVGTNTVTPGDPLYVRFTRVTNTFTWEYSTTGITGPWTVDETTTNAAIGNPVYVVYTLFVTAIGTTSVDLDDFYVAAGTVGSGGFRTTGTWTSATQTYSGEVVDNVLLTFSGATAANYIDVLDVLDSAGATLFSDGTDRTSGTSSTYTVPYSSNLRQDWAVRITLAGGGAGTPTLEGVDITAVPPPSGEGGGNRRVNVSCSLNWLTQFIDCTDYSSYINANIDRVNWYVDGRFAATTGTNAVVILPAGDGFFNAQNSVRHEVVMELVIANGGKQVNTFEVVADYSPRLFLILGIVFIAFLVLALIVRRITTRSVSFPRVRNPSYRRTAISTEEYPRGWVSYRQRDPDDYSSFRTKVVRRDRRKKPVVIAVFGLRPATPTERQRTGRTRIAELQTVRERIPKTRR